VLLPEVPVQECCYFSNGCVGSGPMVATVVLSGTRCCLGCCWTRVQRLDAWWGGGSWSCADFLQVEAADTATLATLGLATLA